MTMLRARWSVAAAILIGVATAGTAGADALTCSTGIARAAAKHLQGLTKAMQKCEDGKVRGRLRETTVCATDPLFDQIRLALLVKLFVSINVACGGPNEDCG